jgi:hypothetical protein
LLADDLFNSPWDRLFVMVTFYNLQKVNEFQGLSMQYSGRACQFPVGSDGCVLYRFIAEQGNHVFP